MLSIRFTTRDARLDARTQNCLAKLSEHPAKSFPKLFDTTPDLEGFYRLMNNPRLSYEELIESIANDTFERLPKDENILIIHDTTPVEPDSKAQTVEEFGDLRGKNHRGFLAHVSIAVGLSDKPIIFGLAGAKLWAREKKENKKKDAPLESARWWEQIAKVQARDDDRRFIHVTDREGDIYSLFSELQRSKSRHVIRLSHDRVLAKDVSDKLFCDMRTAPALDERTASISKREASVGLKQKKIHPSRDARDTVLCLSAKSIEIKCSGVLRNRKPDEYPDTLKVNVIRVYEKSPPENVKPVEWFLVTSESINDISSCWRAVDIYRRRWTIEEFFKGLKTGCQLESRLFASLDSWEKIVSLYLPIAATLVNLKNLGSLESDALSIFSNTQWQILKLKAKKRGLEVNTLADAKAELARIGGHIKWSGPPGWIILARGYEELLLMEVGWNMHRDM